MPEPHTTVADSGLQAERTRLAWSRTAFAVAVNGLLLLHAGGFAGHGASGALPGLVVLMCALAFHLCGAHRYRRVYRSLSEGRPITDPPLMRLMGLLAVVPGLLALGAVLLGPAPR
ncbi:DUF202 domain-containing protein [Wenjunlia tyrosinilytica]|uniref:DUF202 domain-containing protein n=1 Tax=Wenjunlia tyrosinilytica TaxID=1544741 RepID=A0A918DRX4_9ACTN|nr:DUF202 domain-containing protein [Wenjunlia tyrosinilytica]GGO80473.1 hypothetical protein GCM10012280_02470 [Wenjunlia tyrosinilytica]